MRAVHSTASAAALITGGGSGPSSLSSILAVDAPSETDIPEAVRAAADRIRADRAAERAREMAAAANTTVFIPSSTSDANATSFSMQTPTAAAAASKSLSASALSHKRATVAASPSVWDERGWRHAATPEPAPAPPAEPPVRVGSRVPSSGGAKLVTVPGKGSAEVVLTGTMAHTAEDGRGERIRTIDPDYLPYLHRNPAV